MTEAGCSTMGRRGPSIHDIAKIAGVSAATVSNVLNDKGRVSKRTRLMVQEVARSQGYVANFAAKSLREQQTHTVGIVTPDVSNVFHSVIVLQVESLLHGAGYDAFICNSSNDPARMRSYVEGLTRKQVDGFVFVGGTTDISRDALLVQTPAVCIDRLRPQATEGVVEVNNDVRGAVFDMTELLLRRGCERVAFVSVSSRHWSDANAQRFQGYADALGAHGLRMDKNIVLEGDHRQKSHLEAARLVKTCLDEGYDFDGVVAMGDRPALGVENALEARGIGVGTDVLLVGMDNSLYSQVASPSISSVDRDVDQLAERGVEALLRLLADEEAPSLDVIVPHSIVERETTLGPGAAETEGGHNGSGNESCQVVFCRR